MAKYTELQARRLYEQYFRGLYEVCEDQGWGDPFSYARSREIDMAIALDHDVSPTYSGADAYDHGEPVEYKSTINDTSMPRTMVSVLRILGRMKISIYVMRSS